MELSDVNANLPVILKVSDDITELFLHRSTSPSGGHLETDIAAAASLAGLQILQSKEADLLKAGNFRAGDILMYERQKELEDISRFMASISKYMGLDPENGWFTEIPDKHKPHLSVHEMTRRIERDFLAICQRHNLREEYYPIALLFVAIHFVAYGKNEHLLEEDIGKALVMYYVYVGAITVPYPAAGSGTGLPPPGEWPEKTIAVISDLYKVSLFLVTRHYSLVLTRSRLLVVPVNNLLKAVLHLPFHAFWLDAFCKHHDFSEHFMEMTPVEILAENPETTSIPLDEIERVTVRYSPAEYAAFNWIIGIFQHSGTITLLSDPEPVGLIGNSNVTTLLGGRLSVKLPGDNDPEEFIFVCIISLVLCLVLVIVYLL